MTRLSTLDMSLPEVFDAYLADARNEFTREGETWSGAMPFYHPGRLFQGWLDRHDMGLKEAAERTGVNFDKLRDFVAQQQPLDHELALGLPRLTRLKPENWCDFQAGWEMWADLSRRPDLGGKTHTLQPVPA
ncbi:MAG: hypothetical protein AB7H77_03520 [Bdellovibrionales bacterium]